MKKFLGILFVFLVLAGCDDGDATVDAVSFDDSSVASCNNLVFKITENRAMILKFDNVAEAFINDPTPDGTPRAVAVGTGVDASYRVYSGALSAETICIAPAPIEPVAILEWPAESGTVQITTLLVPKPADPVTGQIGISKYRHTIVLKDLRLKKPDGTTQVFTDYPLGTYLTDPENNLPFGFDAEDVRLCPTTNTLYNAQTSGAEGLYVQNVDVSLLDTTVLNQPKTATLGQTNNVLVYRLLASSIPTGENENYFCSGSSSPAVKEEWRAVEGTIEVITTEEAGHFKHTIRLKNVRFKKGNSTFYYGNDMLYGELLV